ncbi:hypothetical protein KW95_18630 [Clostridioides difficile]|nr:hypothetical protein KW95_18630 [Clostridioides difficile]
MIDEDKLLEILNERKNILERRANRRKIEIERVGNAIKNLRDEIKCDASLHIVKIKEKEESIQSFYRIKNRYYNKMEKFYIEIDGLEFAIRVIEKLREG